MGKSTFAVYIRKIMFVVLSTLVKRLFDLIQYAFYAIGFIISVCTVIALILTFAFITCNFIFIVASKASFSVENIVTRDYFSEPSFIGLLSAVIAMISLSGPAIAFYWSMRQNERNKVNLSHDFMREWREGTVPDAMYKVYYFFLEKGHEEARNTLFSLTRDIQNKESKELREAVRTLLNYFEALAAACNNEHVEIDIIKRYFQKLFEVYYERLTPYIMDARRDLGTVDVENDPSGVYFDFTRLAKKWKLTKLRLP